MLNQLFVSRCGVSTKLARALAAFAFIALVPAAHAELVWFKSEIMIEVKPTEARIVAAFPFVNRASEAEAPVLGALPDGMTIVDAPKVLPGAKGELKISVPVGTVAGRRTVTIPTKAGEDLSVVLNIPEHVSITPRKLTWRRGEAKSPKEVQVTLVTREGVTLAETKLLKGDFTCELKKLNDRDYAITVMPPPTDQPVRGIIQVAGKERSGRRSDFNIYADVR